MKKKVLIISSSLRKGSNSETLAKECAKGAAAAGHDVAFVSLKDTELRFCTGCLACQRTGACAIKDGAAEITEKARTSDVIVFATPVYYYEMSGQLKTLLDRMNPLYASDYAFRSVYMIATAAENEETTFEKAYSGLGGWVDCFEKAELKGILTGGGINDASDAPNHPDVMERAFLFGQNL